MFAKSAFCCLALGLIYFFPAPSMLEDIEREKEATPSSLFGSGPEGIVVYRKNNRSERYRGTTIYGAEVQAHHGQMYLVGRSALDNHTSTYMFQLDSIELMRIPNPDHKDAAAMPDTEREELSLRQQVYALVQQSSDLQDEMLNTRKVVRAREKEIEKIESRPETNKLELERLALLKREYELFEKQLGGLEEKAEQTEREFLKKRLEAVAEGVYHKDMDGIR